VARPQENVAGAAGHGPRRVGVRRARAGLRALLVRWLTATQDEDQVVDAAPVVPLRRIVRRFWPYARPRTRWIVLVCLITGIAPVVGAAEVWLYKILVDDVLVPREFTLFWRVALVYLALTVLSGVLSFADDLLSAWVSERFLLDLRTDAFRHLHRLSLDRHERFRVGDLLTRLGSDTAAIEEFLVSGLMTLVASVVQILVLVGLLFYLQWEMALLSLVVAPLFWRIAQRFARLLKQTSREARRRSGNLGALAEESLTNLPVVQAFNAQEREVARYRRAGESRYAAEMAGERLQALYTPVVELVEAAGGLVVLAFGVYQLAQGQLTLGGLLVFGTYLMMLLGPVRGLGTLVTSAYDASAGAERLLEVLDTEPTVREPEHPVALGRARGKLCVTGVGVTYAGRSVPALDDVSLTVHPGEVVAVVGASGAGKSTLVKLLLRFLDPDTGRVTLDGVDLRQVSTTELRDNVSLVLQETMLFDGTVRENIAFGRPGATDAQVQAAARAADAHEFVTALEAGYETRIGPGGRLLSGGQRQRIAIARAMVRDAPVLVLDEPTTGLDPEAAQRVLGPLRRLMAGRTTVLISHNLHLAHTADQVVVLEAGRVVERGTPAELLRGGASYARLRRVAGL
jgi:ABC-type multidrug transport system fused ATPase/permease subunit